MKIEARQINEENVFLKVVSEFQEDSKNIFAATPHEEIFQKILGNAERTDYMLKAFPGYAKIMEELQTLESQPLTGETTAKIKKLSVKLDKMKLQHKHYIVITIEEIQELLAKCKWGMCLNNGFVYLNNGAYWKVIIKEGLQKLFGDIAEKLGVPEFDAKFYQFREALLKQFFAVAHLPKPKRGRGNLLMNFLNGTLDISPGKQTLRPPNPDDFITYQLQFEYNPAATTLLWMAFLDKVLPDKSKQHILAEYLASAFIGNKTLKLEKVLMIVGGGSNGKGVVHEVVTALFGSENVSNFSMESLTDSQGYYRAMIVNKLINYSSENGGKVDPNIFKQLASGEDAPARLPYGEPFQISDYAKLIFNTNKLPKEGVEQTHAFFRRFLIIHFGVTIQEHEADKELHLKIIANELPGVFNWVMDGLHRLLKQKGFTYCEDSIRQVEDYKVQSDSVRSFLIDEEWKASTENDGIGMQALYTKYSFYCSQGGLRPVSIKEFSNRFKEAGYEVKRGNVGVIAYVKQVLAV